LKVAVLSADLRVCESLNTVSIDRCTSTAADVPTAPPPFYAKPSSRGVVAVTTDY